MRKIRLDVDELVVDSFETDLTRGGNGTVLGHDFLSGTDPTAQQCTLNIPWCNTERCGPAGTNVCPNTEVC